MKKHFTATAYIVSKVEGELKVLLHKHKKLNIWIAIGGHVEGENPYQTVLREVKEETNLDIKVISEDKKLLKIKDVEQIFAPTVIIEETIPAYRDEPPHIHIDCIYITFCKKPKKLKIDAEFAWVSKKDVKKMKLGKEVIYLLNKLFKLKVLKSI